MTGHQWLDVLIGIVLALFLILLLVMAVLFVRRPKGETRELEAAYRRRELEAAYRRFSSSDALTTACAQPGCSGTIVDGYCDVCGSPAGAAPFAPAEPAASEASPASAGGPRPMAARWALGVIVGLFLLGAGVVLYRVVPGPQTSASSPSTTPDSAPTETASPSEVPSSAGLSAPSDTGSGSGDKTIQLERLVDSAKPFETVRIQGRYPGGPDRVLRVERWENGKWLAFPLPTKTDKSGRFTAYVEFGQPGRYRLRLLDPSSGLTSKPFVLVIKG